MKSNKKWSMLTLIMMFWFTISFITNKQTGILKMKIKSK